MKEAHPWAVRRTAGVGNCPALEGVGPRTARAVPPVGPRKPAGALPEGGRTVGRHTSVPLEHRTVREEGLLQNNTFSVHLSLACLDSEQP